LKNLIYRIRGWVPKEPFAAYTSKPLKPRWKRPAWIALTLITIVALSFFAYKGIQTLIFYTNPQADVTASYYEKSLNCSTANVGDIIEVQTSVYWHGHVFPEFKRQVNITDAFPENNFQLISGNNTRQYNGYGGGEQITYLLKVISTDSSSIEFPKPVLYLDGAEMSLTGTSPVLELQSVLIGELRT
jgi:hypothetical protein